MKKLDAKVSKRGDSMSDPRGHSYESLAHAWAYDFIYAIAGGEYNGVPRMKAHGNWMYSYDTVIARMFDPPEGSREPLILITTQSYSNTTQRHLIAVDRATSHMNQLFVNDPDAQTKSQRRSNLSDILNEIYELSDKWTRSRKYKDDIAKNIHNLSNTARLYAKYFGLSSSKEAKEISRFLDASSLDLSSVAIESAEEIRKAKKRREKDKARALAKKNAEKYAQAQEELGMWLNFEREYFHMDRYIPDVKLRVRNGVIDTSSGATLSFREAKIAYNRWKKGKLSKGMHIGPYSFGGVDGDEMVHVGCHTIRLDEIERVLEQDPGKEVKELTITELFDELENLAGI